MPETRRSDVLINPDDSLETHRLNLDLWTVEARELMRRWRENYRKIQETKAILEPAAWPSL